MLQLECSTWEQTLKTNIQLAGSPTWQHAAMTPCWSELFWMGVVNNSVFTPMSIFATKMVFDRNTYSWLRLILWVNPKSCTRQSRVLYSLFKQPLCPCTQVKKHFWCSCTVLSGGKPENSRIYTSAWNCVKQEKEEATSAKTVSLTLFIHMQLHNLKQDVIETNSHDQNCQNSTLTYKLWHVAMSEPAERNPLSLADKLSTGCAPWWGIQACSLGVDGWQVWHHCGASCLFGVCLFVRVSVCGKETSSYLHGPQL